MRLIVLMATLLLLALAAPAGAITLVSDADVRTPQRWADEAKVPTPRVTVRLILAPCPNGAPACANVPWYGALGSIYWEPVRASRAHFLHEVGHHFDYEMRDWARDRFRALIGDQRGWRAPPNSPHEKFAEAYSWCARHTHIRRAASRWIFDYRPTPRLHRRACRLIRFAAE